MSANNDQEKDLIVVVSYVLGRPVRMQEALAALGISRSTYYEQRDRGVLNSVPNVLAMADHFELDRVELLVRFGHLDKFDMLRYLEREGEVLPDDATGAPLDPPTTTTTRAVKAKARTRRSRPRARTDITSM